MLADVRTTWDRVPPPDWNGARHAADVIACLDRNGLPRPRDAFELGCGAGRVTRHLAGQVARLTASDASPVQLAAARNIPGVTLRVAEDATFAMTEPFDLFYSFHALHYSPPPLAARALARAFAMLRPGGAAIFQLATYGMGYSYAATDEDRPRHPDPYEDRQVLPQPAVFALARDAACDVLEAFDDASVAPSALWRSSIFVLRKRAA
jgi:SAM-dependent methyltransferase